MNKKTIFILFLYTGYAASMASLKDEDAEKIGMQIWFNEGGQKKELLAFWNEREHFPSLGIGHCIWFPAEKKGLNLPAGSDTFPVLCKHFQKNGVKLPGWLKKALKKGAPWKSRTAFEKDTKRTQELRDLLSQTIPLQIQFMIDQCNQRLPEIIKAIDNNKKEASLRKITLMRSSLQGTYALIDYLNFKGAGLNSHEEGKGDYWGLKQVLIHMPDDVTADNCTQAFAVAAADLLLKRVKNAAPSYKPLIKFFPGWMVRIDTYWNQEAFLSHCIKL